MFKRIVCSSAIKRGASVRLLSKNVAKAASSSTTSYSAATAVPLFAAVPKMLSGQSMIRAFSSQSRLFQEQQTQQQEQQQQQQEQQQQEQQQQEQEQEQQQQQQQEDEFSKIQSLDEAISKLRIQKQTIDAQEAKIRDIQAKALRALADSENARRIAKNDIEKAKKYALQDFAKDLLNVADYLAMATKSVTEEQKQDTVVNNLHTGVAMTEKELHKVFNKYGITTIDPMGQQFDPNTMNALFEVDDPSKPGGTVAVVVKTGVILNDRVIRAAQVGVVKERPDEQKPAQKEGEQQQQQQQQQQGENNNQQ